MQNTRTLALLLACLLATSAEAQQFSQSGRFKAPLNPPPSGPAFDPGIVIDFEEFSNGQQLQSSNVSTLFSVSAQGGTAGLAIYDSSVGGPNDPSLDPDLLVNTGNLLILQSDNHTTQTELGVFDLPTNDSNGGTIRFGFHCPVRLKSIDLVDIDSGDGDLMATLFDDQGFTRSYLVPAGFTSDLNSEGPPGFKRLNLMTRAAQNGVNASTSSSQVPGFNPAAVVEFEIFFEGGIALDRLAFRQSSSPNEILRLPQRSYYTNEPYDAELADLNGDGSLDLVVPSSEGYVVYVYLNPGDGQFDARTEYGVGDRPRGASIADLNGDGFLDLAVFNLFESDTGSVIGGISHSSVSVLIGQGDGTFGPHTEYILDTLRYSIATADFDNDGDLDIVMGPKSTTFSIFLNNGDGTLAAPLEFATAVNMFDRDVLVGDFNGDGKFDLGLPDRNGRDVDTWLGNGDGTFKAPNSFNTIERPQNGFVSDVDLDGDLDIALAADHLLVLPGLGNGRFAEPRVYGSFEPKDTISLADMDDDGDPDAALGAAFPTRVRVFDNIGGGSFAPGDAYDTAGAGTHINLADVDADGALDLVYAGNSSATEILRNRGDNTFHGRTGYPSSSPLSPQDVVVGDLNGDGHDDACVALRTPNSVDVRFGTGTGELGAANNYATAPGPTSLVMGDFNGDSAPDVIAVCESAGLFSVLLNNGDGTLATRVDYAAAGSLSDVTAGDWDGDGDEDLASSSSAAEVVQIFLNTGQGSFVPSLNLNQDRPSSVSQGDFDQDGDLDLAVTRDTGIFEDDVVVIYEGDGAGNFVPGAEYPVVGRPNDLTVADFDGDGTLDLALSSSGAPFAPVTLVISVLLNQGDGTFSPATEIPLHSNSFDIEAGDFDADGDVDMALALTNRSTLSILRNQGDGAFAPPENYSAASPTGVAMADFNSDGRTDFVTSGGGSQTLSVLIAECE